jgi:parallel beta-helix repeat protein
MKLESLRARETNSANTCAHWTQPRGIPRSVGLVILAAAIGFEPAYGISCGDTIRNDVVLTADLGPCTGGGLILSNPEHSITLDLNGHVIKGIGVSIGVDVIFSISSIPVVIKGPGMITHFEAGIVCGGPSSILVEISDLSISNNAVGISGGRCGGRIINNVIRGPGRFGISLGESGSSKIKGNTITGFDLPDGAAIDFFSAIGVNNFVTENVIQKNANGVLVPRGGIDGPRLTIRCNHISHNRQDGIALTGSNHTIEANRVNHNGRDGIALSGSFQRDLVQDNIADSNGRYGIALHDLSSTLTALNQIIDNKALGNGVDLFWDQTGTNSCWKFNIFKTSVPTGLPPCP